MYQKGEKVVCGNKGVCTIEDVTTLNISGIDRNREYYILKPLYMTASTIYIPVDKAKDSIRSVISGDEARALIQKIPSIPLISVTNDKALEQEYKNCLHTEEIEEWFRVIKTIYCRILKRQSVGRKVTALDARYYKAALDCVIGELAVALDIPREEAESYVNEQLEASS